MIWTQAKQNGSLSLIKSAPILCLRSRPGPKRLYSLLKSSKRTDLVRTSLLASGTVFSPLYYAAFVCVGHKRLNLQLNFVLPSIEFYPAYSIVFSMRVARENFPATTRKRSSVVLICISLINGECQHLFLQV